MKSEDFRGKSVVFVGPAPNLIGRGLGSFIDSFDIVVKTGPAYKLTDPDYFRDYGSRIDVLYCNEDFCRTMDKLNVGDFTMRGIKMLKVRFRGSQFYWQYAKRMTVEEIDARDVMATFGGAVLPLMGTIAMLDILQHNPARLFFTGIDFNASRGLSHIRIAKPNDYGEYVPGYIDNGLRQRMDVIRKVSALDAHDSFRDAQKFQVYLDEGRVETHDFIKDTLREVLDAHAVQGQKYG